MIPPCHKPPGSMSKDLSHPGRGEMAPPRTVPFASQASWSRRKPCGTTAERTVVTTSLLTPPDQSKLPSAMTVLCGTLSRRRRRRRSLLHWRRRHSGRRRKLRRRNHSRGRGQSQQGLHSGIVQCEPRIGDRRLHAVLGGLVRLIPNGLKVGQGNRRTSFPSLNDIFRGRQPDADN